MKNLEILKITLFIITVSCFIVGLFYYNTKFANFLGWFSCFLLVCAADKTEKEKEYLYGIVYYIPLLIGIVYFFFIRHV